ncbi:family 26 endoglucanase H/Glycosyl hydrolase [Aspergillus ambiguus]|uniref:family 26 endoglucanase H/Glycosyl hydrolase n=1 Tax=Aspergillus ambiguus TaxID=176160 RepID=UPI003CCD1A24
MLCRISLLSFLVSSLAAGLSYDNVDKAATPRAKELLKYIQSQYGSHYISGQQDTSSLQWVQHNVGVSPAILGTDLMYYSPSAVAHGSKSHTVEDAIKFDKEGGTNALVWHWYAPTCLLDSDKQPWYSGFYTKATCFNVADALAHGGNGTGYGLLIRDIDAIATQLKRLSDEDVPILFRPLHEPEGGWFWWGAHGPAPFKQLWNLIYDRITRVHNIHNSVWVCNTADPNWYPGNKKCDIATIDHYAEAGDHGVLEKKFQSLKDVTRGERVLALAENIPWAYWMTWSDEFIKDGKHNSREFLQNTFNNNRVISLNGASKVRV